MNNNPKKHSNHKFEKPNYGGWNTATDVKPPQNDIDFYDLTFSRRFSILFYEKLLPAYVMMFATIMVGISLVRYNIAFVLGFITDAQLYLDTWLIFIWVLTPSLIWMGVAATSSFRKHAKTWYIWSAVTLNGSLGVTWLIMPEWSSWLKLHFTVSLLCNILLFTQLDTKGYPKSILMTTYCIGAILALLNIVSIFIL
ncbi:MAG: hypothetical protein CMP22_06405 [Rickettsiales bacterium]|nr:hypothetical protein [Rickettsiales bacterium]